jgi:hypothetical protein
VLAARLQLIDAATTVKNGLEAVGHGALKLSLEMQV